MKKNAKKFAYIKNLLYLCIEIKKQDGAATRNSGKKDMKTTFAIKWTSKVTGESNFLHFGGEIKTWDSLEAATRHAKGMKKLNYQFSGMTTYQVVAIAA